MLNRPVVRVIKMRSGTRTGAVGNVAVFVDVDCVDESREIRERGLNADATAVVLVDRGKENFSGYFAAGCGRNSAD